MKAYMLFTKGIEVILAGGMSYLIGGMPESTGGPARLCRWVYPNLQMGGYKFTNRYPPI